MFWRITPKTFGVGTTTLMLNPWQRKRLLALPRKGTLITRGELTVFGVGCEMEMRL